MSYLSSDEFANVCYECDFDIPSIQAALTDLGVTGDIIKPSKLKQRIANLKRKGILPLDSGNIVDSSTVLKGTSTLYGADGSIKQQWVKSDVPKEQSLDAFKEAIQNIASFLPLTYDPSTTPQPTETTADLMTIYPIGDAHVGMLAHEAETGEDHDLKISVSRHMKAIHLAVSKAAASEQAFIIDTGDWFHADSSLNRTARGNNPLDVDGRYHKVIEAGFRIATIMIEAALAKHNEVHWRSAIGNHNEHSAIMLSYYLEGYFRNEPRVVIHTSPSMFFYHQFGSNLIGVTHGHTAKPANLPGIMATDEPKLWGNTKHRYWYLGHLHHDILKEMPGCRLETFRTLASKDAWHHSMGYRSGQDIKTITLHKDYGEISRNTFNVELVDIS